MRCAIAPGAGQRPSLAPSVTGTGARDAQGRRDRGRLGLKLAMLSVLQDHEITRVGGAYPIRVDVRVIAATHRDLRAEIEAGRSHEEVRSAAKGVTFERTTHAESHGE